MLLVEFLAVKGLVVKRLDGSLALVGRDSIDASDGLSGKVGMRTLAAGHLARRDDDALLLI